MAMKCAHCGSAYVQTNVDAVQCMECGQTTTYANGAVAPEDRTVPRDLNEPLVQDFHPHGSPATEPRTPDGVPDPGTNIEGMSDADKWGTPVTPDADDRPTSMQTEHTTRDAEPQRSDVHVNDPRGHDMHDHGFVQLTDIEQRREARRANR